MLDSLIDTINRRHRAVQYSEDCAQQRKAIRSRRIKRLTAAIIGSVVVCLGVFGLHRTFAKADNLNNHTLKAGRVLNVIEGGREGDLVTVLFDDGNVYDIYGDDFSYGDRVVAVVNTKGTEEITDDIVRDLLYVRR